MQAQLYTLFSLSITLHFIPKLIIYLFLVYMLRLFFLSIAQTIYEKGFSNEN